jgi:ribosomal protein L11 methyltransferase
VKLGAVRALGIEIDAEANVVAVRNASRNEVRDQVEFLDGDAGDLAPLLGPADLLLSNILRRVNAQLLPAIGRSLRPGGVAIFSGMEQAEAPLFRPLLSPAGLTVVDEQRDAGWWSVAARRE